MASIKEVRKKDGSMGYKVIVYVGRDASGKQIFKYSNYTPASTAPSKIRKEVERYALEFEQKVLSANIQDGDKITVEAFVDIWKKN